MENECKTLSNSLQDVFVAASPARVEALASFTSYSGSDEGLEAPVVAPTPVRGRIRLSPYKRLIPYGEDTGYFRQDTPPAAGAPGPITIG